MRKILSILALVLITIPVIAGFAAIYNNELVMRICVFAVWGIYFIFEIVDILQGRKENVTLEDVKRLIEENNAELRKTMQA